MQKLYANLPNLVNIYSGFNLLVAKNMINIILDSPFFRVLHFMEYQIIPNNNEVIDLLFGEEFDRDKFMISTIPLVFCLRLIWKSHEDLSCKYIFDIFLKYHDSEKLKSYFQEGGEKYNFVLDLLQKLGPISKEELESLGKDMND